jgi:hypothetical protein
MATHGSGSTDEIPGHSTGLSKNDNQVAGYMRANALHSHSAQSPEDGDINRWLTLANSLVVARSCMS